MRTLFATGLGRSPRHHVLLVVAQSLAIDLHEVCRIHRRRTEQRPEQEGQAACRWFQTHATDLITLLMLENKSVALRGVGQRRNDGFKNIDRVERILFGANHQLYLHGRYLADNGHQPATDLELTENRLG